MRIWCWIKTIWLSMTHLMIISGHNYVEIYNNKDISVLQCEDCNYISVGFYSNGRNDK